MNEHQGTIFDKILDGSIPSHTVYEDEHVYAFLDIGPLSEGHTLVIPRERKAFLHELSDDAGAAIGRALPKIARAVMNATGAEAYNILQNNGADAHQAVFHVHFHIIPRFRDRPAGQHGLGITWNTSELDHGRASELLTKIRSTLAS